MVRLRERTELLLRKGGHHHYVPWDDPAGAHTNKHDGVGGSSTFIYCVCPPTMCSRMMIFNVDHS